MLRQCYGNVTSVLKPELKPCSKYIILHIAGVAGQRSMFIFNNVVPKYQSNIFIDLIIITKGEGSIFYIGSIDIISGLPNFFSFYFGIGIVPIVFNTYLMMRI